MTKVYKNQAYSLFNVLDDKVTRLYSPALGARFMERSAEQADHIGVNVITGAPAGARSAGDTWRQMPRGFQPAPCWVIKG